MERRGYSNNRRQFHTVSRSDRATSWRAGRSSNNENAVDNNSNMSTKNNMISKSEGIESWWNTIPNRYAPYPHSSRPNGPNNQHGAQGYQLFASYNPNMSHPPPPGLTTVLTQTPIHAPLLPQRFENNRFTNNNNENLYSFCQRSTADYTLQQHNIMTNNNIQQQQQPQQVWMPLRDISTNTQQSMNGNNFNKQKKAKLDPIGPPPPPLSWSSVVSRGVVDNNNEQQERQESLLRDCSSMSEATAFNNNNLVVQQHRDKLEDEASHFNSNNHFMHRLEDEESFVVQQHHVKLGDHQQHGGPSIGTRYLSDSVGFMMNNMFNNSPQHRPYTVIKIRNIPWSISSEDIGNILKRSNDLVIPSEVDMPQSIHIIMDTKTGKTCGVAYAEVQVIRNRDSIGFALDHLSTLPLQGRRLKFVLSNYDELRNNLFANWNGEFKDNQAIPYYSDAHGGPVVLLHGERSTARTGDSKFFIGQKELQSLLNICRNYKVYYNRKCPERSFEYLMSITINIPWLQSRIVSTIQRDIIYECYKLATDALRIHTSKPFHSFETSLLPRLVRAALMCDGFTAKQKNGILNNARIPCPDDLQKYIQEPTPPSPATPTLTNPTIADFMPMMEMMGFDE